jgi:hypothetical protein
MKKVLLVLVMALSALSAAAATASAATSFVRVGAFAEGLPDGPPSHHGRIAVSHDTGDVYVTDQINDRVVVYRPNGTGADLLATFGSGDVTDPRGIAIDQSDGSVYVADDDNVVRYDSDGAPTPTFTKDNSFASPGVTGPLSFDQGNDQLLVADVGANVVRRYSTDGVAGATFDGSAGSGSPGAFVGLQDLAVDTTGDVIVIDADGDPGTGATSRVERFDSTGSWEATIGPVDQAATVAVVPATNDLIVGGNQDSVNTAEKPTLRRFDAAGADLGAIGVDDAVLYGTISGIAVDDGAAGRLSVATDVSAGSYPGSYGLISVQAYDVFEQAEATISAPTAVTATGATVAATVNPHGSATTYRFEYSGDGGGTWTKVAGPDGDPETDDSAGSGSSAVPVETVLAGLQPRAGYQVRLVVSNIAGPVETAPESFTTGAAPPAATTGTAANVTEQTAKLQGTVDSQGAPTTYQFEYGPTSAYGTTIPAGQGDAGSGNDPRSVTAYAGGLTAGQTYHYRLVATNDAGTTAGADRTFTAAAPSSDSATGSPNPEPGKVPGKGFLPDDRGWEKVSPADKGGIDIAGDSTYARTKASTDGNGLIYTAHGVFAGAPSGGYPSYYQAKRGPDGWTTDAMLPRSVGSPISGVGGAGRTATVLFANDDLTRSVVETNTPIAAGSDEYVPTLFTRDNPTGVFAPMSPGGPSLQDAFFGAAPFFQAATPDGSHVLFYAKHPFTADAPADGDKLYESINGDIRLAGILPDGTPATNVYAGSNGVSTNNAISVDGKRVYFTDSYSGVGTLYERENGQTRKVDASGDGNRVLFYTASPDGRYAVYRRGGLKSEVLRYDAVTGTSVNLSPDNEPADGTSPDVKTVLATSDDLSYVYFMATGDLVAGQEPIGGFTSSVSAQLDTGLYLWHDGEVRHLATLRNVRDEPLAGPISDPYGIIPNLNGWINRPWVSWSDDGKSLAFDTTAVVTGDDAGGAREVYRYSAVSDEVSCLTCDASPGGQGATLMGPEEAGGGTWARPLGARHSISADGSQVTFSSAAGLVGQDTNGKLDVYRWKAGDGIRLLSSGVGQFDARLLTTSASGSDVFFATRGRLVGGDEDDLVDLYDARVGGGRPEPSAAPTPCAGDDCQGATVNAEPPKGAGSSAVGSGNPVSPGPRARARLRPLSASARAALARSGRTTLVVTTSRAGTVTVVARARVGKRTIIVGRASARAGKAGVVRVTLRLSKAARRQLSQRKTLRVQLAVTFTGQRGSQVSVVNLKKGR